MYLYRGVYLLIIIKKTFVLMILLRIILTKLVKNKYISDVKNWQL